MATHKEKNEWGEGLDYLFKDIWPDLDRIRRDNENYSHNEGLISSCFLVMQKVLAEDAVEAVKNNDWDIKDKVEVLEKMAQALGHFKEAKTVNDKVIAINVAEQLLRAIY
jgi:hypothetical protein